MTSIDGGNLMNIKLKFKSITLLTISFMSVLSFTNALLAQSNTECLSDFRVITKQAPHNIPQEIISHLHELAQRNNPMEGWKLLGEQGDQYAAIAYQVLNPKAQVPYSAYRKLIQRHWINSVGSKKYLKNFDLVASQHFRQYVSIVSLGFLPDSDQIINSYYQAIRDHQLPDVTVFDGAWEAAGMNSLATWQSLNHLKGNREVYPSRACSNINKFQAMGIISMDLTQVPFYLFSDM